MKFGSICYIGCMTRSRRKSLFTGYTTAATDKPWKQQSARQVRRAAHQVIATTLDADAVPDRRVLGDPYGQKDGKQRITDPRPEDFRK